VAESNLNWRRQRIPVKWNHTRTTNSVVVIVRFKRPMTWESDSTRTKSAVGEAAPGVGASAARQPFTNRRTVIFAV